MTSVGLIGLEGNVTSKDVTRSCKMAVISTFFNSDTGEIMAEQESECIRTTQVIHRREFHFTLQLFLMLHLSLSTSIYTDRVGKINIEHATKSI